jgi:hypothetical protein
MFALLLGCSSGFSGGGGVVFGGLSAALLDGDEAGVNIVPAALKLIEASVGVDDELLEQCLHVGGIWSGVVVAGHGYLFSRY